MGPAGDAQVDLVLTECGHNKLRVINILRETLPELDLKAALAMVEDTPHPVLENVSLSRAAVVRARLTAAGADSIIRLREHPAPR